METLDELSNDFSTFSTLLEDIPAEMLRIIPDSIIGAISSGILEGMYGEIPGEIWEATLAKMPKRISVDIPLGISGQIPGGSLKKKNTGTITGVPSEDILGEIPGAMSGERPREILEKRN